MAEKSKKWYVIRAISGKEKRVKELLELDNLVVVNLNHNHLEFLELKGLLNKE